MDVNKASGEIAGLLSGLARLARESGLFASVAERPGLVECAALTVPDRAFFRIAVENGALYVSWVTPDRYMSQSVEADLMWTGDDLSELINEELLDVGWKSPPLGKLEHFRSEERLFTFRSQLPINVARIESGRDAAVAKQALKAYEAAFRELGDMKAEEDE